MALSSAQDVIADYNDDGQIQGCYSAKDFNDAVDKLDPNNAIYEASRDIIRQAQARCLAAEPTKDEGGGGGAGLWIGLAAGVIVVAAGAGLMARRRGSGTPPGDGDPPGDGEA